MRCPEIWSGIDPESLAWRAWQRRGSEKDLNSLMISPPISIEGIVFLFVDDGEVRKDYYHE